MALIGYARAFTEERTTDAQIDALKLAGCKSIHRQYRDGLSPPESGVRQPLRRTSTPCRGRRVRGYPHPLLGEFGDGSGSATRASNSYGIMCFWFQPDDNTGDGQGPDANFR